MFHTSAPVVREWLQQAGIPVKPRTTRATRAQLDPRHVRELYEQRQWNSTEIAAHLDCRLPRYSVLAYFSLWDLRAVAMSG